MTVSPPMAIGGNPRIAIRGLARLSQGASTMLVTLTLIVMAIVAYSQFREGVFILRVLFVSGGHFHSSF